DKRYIFFRAKLLKVELSHAYFQVQDNIYKVQTGQNLADAMGYARAYKGQKGQNLTDEKTGRPVTQPLNAFWLNLETAGLFDVRWAASQSGGKDKADNKGKGVKKLGAR
ncbi:MAG: hypothetical protein HYR84_14085, partial [Planctomycetes bacterium]|nr:hypothetical protein [Planctomycetota bacterium]